MNSEPFVWTELNDFLKGRKVIVDVDGYRWVNENNESCGYLTLTEVKSYQQIICDYNLARFRHEFDFSNQKPRIEQQNEHKADHSKSKRGWYCTMPDGHGGVACALVPKWWNLSARWQIYRF